jgi:1-phosphofructokinase
MKIITVTLNPSLDRTLVVNYLNVGYHNQAISGNRVDAAGRGMNISAALQSLGAQTEALILLGDDPFSHAYEALLKDGDVQTELVRFEGHIRSNLFIKDAATGAETVIKEEMAEISEAALHAVRDKLVERIELDDFVVLAGALPHNAKDDTFAWLARIAHQHGARVVLDTDGDYLRQGIASEPYLVFLNQQQAEAYFNFPVRMPEDVLYCAQQLREQGAQRALIMMANDAGALMFSDDEQLLIEFHDDWESGTHSGAYDAMLAGYLLGRLRQRPLDQALKLGAAAASYTASQVGNEFGSRTDIEEHLDEINITQVDSQDTD